MNQAMGLSVCVAAVSKRMLSVDGKTDYQYHSKVRIIPAFLKVNRRKTRKPDADNFMMHQMGINVEYTPSIKRIQGTLHA